MYVSVFFHKFKKNIVSQSSTTGDTFILNGCWYLCGTCRLKRVAKTHEAGSVTTTAVVVYSFFSHNYPLGGETRLRNWINHD